MRVYIETYGCALNKSDEALMVENILREGHELVNSIEDADTLIINTCIVRLDTEYHMVKRIRELYEVASRTGKKLIVAGCMAKAEPYTVLKIAPEASLVSPQNSALITEVLKTRGKVILIDGLRERDRIGIHVEDRIAPIPIQEGCLSNCSFCITKHARRILVSHGIDAVVKAVERAVRNGAVEIQLTGMDLGTYGLDLYKTRKLPELVKEVSRRVSGEYMIRIGMINPEHLRYILDDLIDAINESSKVYRFLHIPLQSGSNKVLSVMRRNYSVEEYIEIVNEVKSRIPGVSIATDIIVGHPMEDEEDFNETLKVIRELEFERVHLAGYSIRPLTYSASLPQVPTRVKKERVLRALQVIEEVGLKIRLKYVGKEVECFTTEHLNTWICRLENYIPVVVTGKSGDPALDYGRWIRVLVDNATFFDLRGRFLESK